MTKEKSYHGAHNSAVYGLGFVGAVIYFIAHATSFWMGVLGFFKAIVWPAFLVYKAFEFMNNYFIGRLVYGCIDFPLVAKHFDS